MIPKKIVMILITLAAPLLLVVLSLSGCQTTPTQPAQVTPTIIAQPMRCAHIDRVISFLKNRFDERPTFTGVYENQIIIMVFINEKTNSFTVTHTAKEISCLVSSGDRWKELVWDKENKSV